MHSAKQINVVKSLINNSSIVKSPNYKVSKVFIKYTNQRSVIFCEYYSLNSFGCNFTPSFNFSDVTYYPRSFYMAVSQLRVKYAQGQF